MKENSGLKTVLITGGTGSFGQAMLRDLLDRGVEQVRVLSRDEEKQDALRNTLRDDRVRFYIGDVRDREAIDRAIIGVEAVFHAAALKQVPSCEFFPHEAVQTNVIGSQNVIRASIAAGVKSLVCLSTDKAVFPVNAMGMTKALMEKTAQSAARELGPLGKTVISVVRYGNVLYSRGSVIPLFVRQITSGQPITITEPTMTRFLMPLRDSVSLVHHAFEHAEQGDLFIKKAPAATIADLVEALKGLFGAPDHPIEIIGRRLAEKQYETLASAQELANSADMGAYHRVMLEAGDLNYKPYFSEGNLRAKLCEGFHSNNAERLDLAGIKALLQSLPEMQAARTAWKVAR